MVDAHDLYGMFQMAKGILYGCLPLLDEEAMIECHLHHPTLLRQCPHLVVSQVAGMVAERTATAVAAHDRRGADVQRIVEATLVGMAEVNHDAQSVHLSDDLPSEVADPMMRIAAPGRIADIVVTIMAERHIDDAPLCKVAELLQLTVQSQSVLDAQHDALPALPLVGIQVCRRTGDAEISTISVHDLLYLVEYQVRISRRSRDVERHL